MSRKNRTARHLSQKRSSFNGSWRRTRITVSWLLIVLIAIDIQSRVFIDHITRDLGEAPYFGFIAGYNRVLTEEPSLLFEVHLRSILTLSVTLLLGGLALLALKIFLKWIDERVSRRIAT